MLSTHSERSAIQRLQKLIAIHVVDAATIRKGFYILNLAFNSNGEVKISKPCTSCAKLITSLKFKIHRIYWSMGCGQFESASKANVSEGAIPSTGDAWRGE